MSGETRQAWAHTEGERYMIERARETYDTNMQALKQLIYLAIALAVALDPNLHILSTESGGGDWL